MHIGMRVLIIANENMSSRIAPYVDTWATLQDIPTFPNTWFTVVTYDNKDFKLRKTQFLLPNQVTRFVRREESSSNADSSTSSSVTQAQARGIEYPKSFSIPSASSLHPGISTNGNIRSKNSTQRLSGSHSGTTTSGMVDIYDHIKPGMRVKITPNNDVLRFTPDLVGKDAEIVEVPVHPNTWFKVRLLDGKQVKLRKTAIHIENEKDLIRDSARKKDMERRQKYLSSHKKSADFVMYPASLSSSTHSDALHSPMLRFSELSIDPRIDYNTWVGKEVNITKGAGSPGKGIVKEYSNQVFRVDTGDEIISKHVSQVDVVGDVQRFFSPDLQFLSFSPKDKRDGKYPSFSPRSPKRIRGDISTLLGSTVEIVSGLESGKVGKITGVSKEQVFLQLSSGASVVKKLEEVRPSSWDRSIHRNWIGKRVKIASGKYSGHLGTINGVENGSYIVNVDNSGEIIVPPADLELEFEGEKPEIQEVYGAANILMDLMVRSSSSPLKPVSPATSVMLSPFDLGKPKSSVEVGKKVKPFVLDKAGKDAALPGLSMNEDKPTDITAKISAMSTDEDE